MKDSEYAEPTCQNCGTPNPTSNKFCRACGDEFVEPVQAAPDPLEAAIPKEVPLPPAVVKQRVRNRTQAILVIGCVGLFIGCVAMGGVATCIDNRRIQQEFASANFNGTGEIITFMEANGIEIDSDYQDEKSWEASLDMHQEMVTDLENQYRGLLEQEEQAAGEYRAAKEAKRKERSRKSALSLLKDMPDDGFIKYVNDLQECLPDIDDDTLIARINERIIQCKPHLDNEWAHRTLENPPEQGHKEFVAELEALLPTVTDSQLRRDIKTAITKHTKLADAEEAERTRQVEIEQAEAVRQAELDEAKAARLAVIGPKPEQSIFGRVQVVSKYLEQNLDNPDSLVFEEWSDITDLEKDGEFYWHVSVKFRVDNAYGVNVLKEYDFFMRHGEVVASQETGLLGGDI